MHKKLLYTLFGIVFVSLVITIIADLRFHTGTTAPQMTTEKYVVPSKYSNIQIKTVEEQADNKRYLLSASWPVTENAQINADLDTYANDFITDYRTQTAQIQMTREAYIQKTGEDGVRFHAVYNLHFDVSFANKDYVAFIFITYRNTGNSGNDETTSLIYNRTTGERIPISALFADRNYLQILSSLARQDVYGRVEKVADSGNFADAQKRAEWIEDLEKNMVDPGTTPTAKNFHSMTLSEDGFLVINFDKYQVAPGYWGIVTVQIPLSKVANLFTPEVQQLFELSSTSSSTAQAIPPPTLVPVTPNPTDCKIAKCVALTFDDGPSIYTENLLAILKKENVFATFFMLGVNVKVQQQTVIDVANAGMELGNHTWDHKDLSKLSVEAIQKEVGDSADLIEKITSGIRPFVVRPPYGAINAQVRASVSAPLILWNVDPEDWKYRDTDHVEKAVLAQTKRNSIILMHDVYSTTVAAVPTIIDTLKSEGYTFVTIDELIGSKKLIDGHVYY